MRRASTTCLAAIVLGVLGCNAMTGIDDYSTSSNAPDGVDDPGVGNMLVDPGFEQGACSGWEAQSATLEEVTIAYAGTRACKVCGDAVAGVYGIGQRIDAVGLTPGTQYVMEAWTRQSDPDTSSNAMSALVVTYLGDGTPVDGNETPGPGGSETWRHQQAALTYGGGADYMIVSIIARKGGTCFVVDHASLHVGA